jgi:HK97 family phage portal protein
MALLDDIAKSTASLISKRLYGLGKDEQYSVVERFGGDTPSKRFLDSYEGIVYACISAISEEVGNYKPLIHKPKGDDLIQVKQHPLLELLDNPQPDEPAGISTYELFEATQSFIELTGECFWYKVLGEMTGKPKAIYILRPDRMGIDVDDNGDINGYFLRRSVGEPIPFEVNEIEHFKMFNPKNPYRGYGTIEASSDYIATERNTSKFTSNFFGNNAGLSGVLSVKGEVTKNAFKKFVSQWREKYQGVDNAGKVAILRESDAVFTKVGLGLNELDMTALRKMTIDEVLMMFRVPKAMLGISDESGLGRASVETLEYIFTKRVVVPKMRRIDSVIQRMADRHWRDEKLIISHDNIVPSDKEFELKERQAGVDVWLTRNEIREQDGLDDADGGDKLRAPLASAPLDFDQETDAGASKSVKVIKLAKPTTTVITTAKKKDPSQVAKADDNRSETFRLSLMRNQTAYERKYKKSINKVLREQEQETLNNLEGMSSGKSLTKKDLSQLLFSLSDAVDKFDQAQYPILLDMYTVQGGLALIFAGDEESEFKVTEQAQKAMHDSTRRMAKNYNQETIDRLTATLSEGLADGEALGKLKKRVAEVYEEARGYRAERISRTETLKASNSATNFAYKQTGYVKGKQWFANPDHCGYCDTLDGKIVGLDENFANMGESVEGDGDATYAVDYEDIGTPPVHPNCRCTIIPVR